MFPQLAVFEFRMYFLPGFLCISTIFGVLLTMGSVELPVEKLGDITESLVFLFGTLLVGQIIQIVGAGFKIRGKNYSITKPLEWFFWNSSIPSELALVKNSALINDTQRKQIIRTAQSERVLTEEEAKRLEENENEKTLSHRVFYTKLKGCSDKPESGVKESESLYQMLRGFYCVALLSFIVSLPFLAVRLINISWTFFEDSFGWASHFGWTLISIFLVFLFGYRLRGIAEGFVKEVLYLYLKRDI